MILISYFYFPPDWFPAKNSYESTSKEISQTNNTVKPPIQRSLYQLPPTKENLMRYLKFESDKYGLNDRLSELEYTITNESNWDVDVVNKKSKGISQFLLSTWLGSCSNKDDREDAYKSIECMTMMWSKGLDYQWDAYCLHYWDEDCINKRNIYPIK